MVTGSQGVASIQAAAGAHAAVGKDLRQWAIRPKSPRWNHAKGNQPEVEPSRPALCN